MSRDFFYDFGSPEIEIRNLYPYTDTTTSRLRDYTNICLYKAYCKAISKMEQ